MTVECTKDPTSTDYESYILTITKYTESGTTTNVVEYTSEKDLTKYSGLYDKRTVGLDDSKIWDAYGNEHKAPRIMNISEFRT